MSSRPGRPRKNQPLYAVRDWVEYTSDSDSDFNNVQENVPYQVQVQSEAMKWSSASNFPPTEIGTKVPSGILREEDIPAEEQEFLGDNEQQSDEEVTSGYNQEAEVTYSPTDENEGDEEAGEDEGDEDNGGENEGDEEAGEDEGEENEGGEDDGEENEYLEPDDENYDAVLKKLQSEWLLLESSHKVSKTATDLFWKVALKLFPKLKTSIGNKRTCQFKTIRRKMYDDCVPEVSLEIGYKNKRTGDVQVVNERCTPVKQFPPSQFEKFYEIGSLKVSYIHIYKYIYIFIIGPKKIEIKCPIFYVVKQTNIKSKISGNNKLHATKVARFMFLASKVARFVFLASKIARLMHFRK